MMQLTTKHRLMKRRPKVTRSLALALVSTIAFATSATAELLRFEVLGVRDDQISSINILSGDPHALILGEVGGAFFFNTVTQAFDLHLSGGFENGPDFTLAGWGMAGTTRPGHETMSIANLDGTLIPRGFGDGKNGGNGTDAELRLADGRYFGLDNLFFAANPWEQTLFIEVGSIANISGNGYLALRLGGIDAPVGGGGGVSPGGGVGGGGGTPQAEIPEPASALLLLSGLVGTAYRKRRSNS